MVGDSLGYRDHAEVACGVLGYGGYRLGVHAMTRDEMTSEQKELSEAILKEIKSTNFEWWDPDADKKFACWFVAALRAVERYRSQ